MQHTGPARNIARAGTYQHASRRRGHVEPQVAVVALFDPGVRQPFARGIKAPLQLRGEPTPFSVLPAEAREVDFRLGAPVFWIDMPL